MIDIVLLTAALFFGVLTVYSRDNVYSAASLAAAAGSVALFFLYLTQFAAAFLLLVIYIGAVMLLVIMTAAMFNTAQRWSGRQLWATTIVFMAAVAIAVATFGHSQMTQLSVQVGDLTSVVVLLFAVAVVSLLVSTEIAKKT